MIIDPLNDGKSSVELIDFMGGELAIVNDARVSFGKQVKLLTEKDIKLINYLITHEHFSPLRSTVFKFRIKAPLFVCRQIWKYVVASNHLDEQLSHNEQSLRYVQANPEFYFPKYFRQQSLSNKQASIGVLPDENNSKAVEIYENTCFYLYENYNALLELGVAREQARGLLPNCTYTEWIWTSSLQCLLHFITQRLWTDGAQQEIACYAEALLEFVEDKCPNVVQAYLNKFSFYEQNKV